MKRIFVGSIALLMSGAAYAGDNPPNWLHQGPVSHYDGASDDLATAGLGAEAMTGTPPTYADVLHPTAKELRRAAMFYRASKGQGVRPPVWTQRRRGDGEERRRRWQDRR